jgi:hypothetical protein
MKEELANYVKRVKDLAEHVKGNEQATKQSLIAPLFVLLGYDITDPRECMPEFKADFGKDRSNKPVDWAFMLSGKPIFFVEAKEAGKKLAGHDEQLGDYFAKVPEVKLGILTNGVQWRFFTDLVNANVMDNDPFVKWDVVGDETPPFDFLTLLQKSQFNPQLIRTFAERKRAHNLLVNELNKLLEPVPEFTKLLIANIETRHLTASVVESWKPVVASAINEWVKQKMLSTVLEPQPQQALEADAGKPPEASAEELDAFSVVAKLLGPSRPIALQPNTTYAKLHLPEKHTWAVARLYLGRRKPKVWVPVPVEKVQALAPGLEVVSPEPGWVSVAYDPAAGIGSLAEVIRFAWDQQRAVHPASQSSVA